MANTSLLGSYGGIDGSALMFRNRIINGDMRIDQRNAGAKVQLDSKFGVDRFAQYIASNFFTAGLQQKTDTPPSDFSHYLRISADAVGTSTAAQYGFLTHRIEGLNVSDFSWGTSSAKTVTLSFWTRSSLTGTFSGSIQNNTEDRSYIFSFNISAANTWEYKTIIIPGCTDGTWDKTTNSGIKINWDYGSGSARRSTTGSWLSGNFNGATGSVSISQTLNATLDLTGVQLEAGAVATPFERRPFGTELALCQRYFYTLSSGTYLPGTGVCVGSFLFSAWPHPTTMRIAPAVTLFGTDSGAFFTTNDDTTYGNYGTITLRTVSDKQVGIRATLVSGTTGLSGIVYIQTGRALLISAEL